MPFSNPVPHSFTAMSIGAYAPVDGGVYGLSNSREWLFIGTAENIRQTLSMHLRDRGALLTSGGQLGFVYEACPTSVRELRRRQLIAEYAPARNRAEIT